MNSQIKKERNPKNLFASTNHACCLSLLFYAFYAFIHKFGWLFFFFLLLIYFVFVTKRAKVLQILLILQTFTHFGIHVGCIKSTTAYKLTPTHKIAKRNAKTHAKQTAAVCCRCCHILYVGQSVQQTYLA